MTVMETIEKYSPLLLPQTKDVSNQYLVKFPIFTKNNKHWETKPDVFILAEKHNFRS